MVHLDHDRYEEAGLHPYHHAILAVLDEGSRETQGAIADALGYDKGQLVGLLDELENAGLIERRRDPTDRRRYAIHLTRKGKTLLARAREAAQAAEEALLADLDADERRVLHILLVKVSMTVDRTPGPDINCGPLR